MSPLLLLAAAVTTNPHIAAAPLIVTEFAVPVGVPVAPLAPLWYTYAPSAARNDDALAERVASRVIRALQGSTTSAAVRPTSLITQHCARCHSGPNPKGDLSLALPDQLDAATRLKATHSVLTGKMPPATPNAEPIPPDELRKLLEELTNAK